MKWWMLPLFLSLGFLGGQWTSRNIGNWLDTPSQLKIHAREVAEVFESLQCASAPCVPVPCVAPVIPERQKYLRPLWGTK